MKGDISRFTFNPLNNYLGVLKQQGRIELDSDWNEQGEIYAEHLRQLTADLVGQFAVPLEPNDIARDNSHALEIRDYSVGPGGIIDFKVGHGLAYIGGYLFRLIKDVTYYNQSDYPEPEAPSSNGDLLVYIEAWNRVVSYIDNELIREPALGGPDTCLRSALTGQIKVLNVKGLREPSDALQALSKSFSPTNVALTLQIDQSAYQLPLSFGEVDLGGGMIPGNLHYRLELHRGITSNGDSSEGIKWSDENAAIAVRALRMVDNNSLIIEELEQITGESLKPGDWVEISNLMTELHRQGGQMAKIASLESASGGLLVTLDSDIHPLLARRKNGPRSALDQGLAPRLRRWSGYFSPLELKLVYDLGRGVKAIFNSGEKKIQFEPADYWTFAIRDREYNKRYAPQKTPPVGIRKFRQPLAIIVRKENGEADRIIDCRRFFRPLAGIKTE
jgi:hypothetical protein